MGCTTRWCSAVASHAALWYRSKGWVTRLGARSQLSAAAGRLLRSNERALATGGDVYADGDLLAPEFLEVCEAQVSLLEHALDVPTKVTVRSPKPDEQGYMNVH